MRKYLAWACYGAGDLLSRIGTLWPDREGALIEGSYYWLIFRPYQRLMVWSHDLQGEGSGPWEPAETVPLWARNVDPLYDASRHWDIDSDDGYEFKDPWNVNLWDDDSVPPGANP